MRKISLLIFLIVIETSCIFAQSSTSNILPRSFSYNSSTFSITPEFLIAEYNLQKPNIDSIMNYKNLINQRKTK
ncbi:MAG: hypothetical protein NT007_15720 [Candidatus Kapabacteria bacterium]|nr:hypothetical protein [Candidatus Kapabacteria bacterium]